MSTAAPPAGSLRILRPLQTNQRETVVLLVEDDQDTRAGMSLSLAARGYQVHPAESGCEALQAADDIRPSVVLLDLGLPDADGLAVLEALQTTHKDAQVIVLSARDRAKFEPQAMRLGAALYLEKPITGEAVAQAIEGLIS